MKGPLNMNNHEAMVPRKKCRQAGFTLVELMVVVIVLAILAATIIPQFSGTTYDTKVSKTRSDIAILETQLELFKLHLDRYPTDQEGLRALVRRPVGAEKRWRGPYIKELRRDSWDSDYRYRTGVDEYGNPIYLIWSMGADGAQGGEGENKDISNRQEAQEK